MRRVPRRARRNAADTGDPGHHRRIRPRLRSAGVPRLGLRPPVPHRTASLSSIMFITARWSRAMPRATELLVFKILRPSHVLESALSAGLAVRPGARPVCARPRRPRAVGRRRGDRTHCRRDRGHRASQIPQGLLMATIQARPAPEQLAPARDPARAANATVVVQGISKWFGTKVAVSPSRARCPRPHRLLARTARARPRSCA